MDNDKAIGCRLRLCRTLSHSSSAPGGWDKQVCWAAEVGDEWWRGQGPAWGRRWGWIFELGAPAAALRTHLRPWGTRGLPAERGRALALTQAVSCPPPLPPTTAPGSRLAPCHPRCSGHSRAWAAVPPPRAVKKSARPRPTHDCPPQERGPFRHRAARRSGRPRGWVRGPARLQLPPRARCAARSLGPGARPACSVFLRIPKEGRNQRLGIEKQGRGDIKQDFYLNNFL